MAGDQEAPSEDSHQRAHGSAATSVWLREEVPSRSRRTLTREGIVVEAVGLLDDQGIGRMTMRRLAERIGVTSTALYWHVKTKEEVLDLAFDHVFGFVEIPRADGEWRSDVRALLLGWRKTMLDHPWTTALVGRPMLGPNVLARTEYLYSTLAGTGLSGIELSAITQLFANYVIGTAAAESTWHQAETAPEQQALAWQRIEDNRDVYPTLYQSGHFDEQRASSDELFERSLDMLITRLVDTA